MKITEIKIIVLLLLLVVSDLSFAEDSLHTEEKRYWISAGYGGGTYNAASGVSLSLQQENHLYSVRFVAVSETSILDFFPDAYPSEYVQDVSFLYGRVTKSEGSVFAYSIGLGSVEGVRRGDYIGTVLFQGETYEQINYSALGIPVEFKYFSVEDGTGIGLYAFANINKEKSFVGVMLSLHFGKF